MTTLEIIESKPDTDYTFGEAIGKKARIKWRYRKRGMAFTYQLLILTDASGWSRDKTKCLAVKDLEEFINRKIN